MSGYFGARSHPSSPYLPGFVPTHLSPLTFVTLNLPTPKNTQPELFKLDTTVSLRTRNFIIEKELGRKWPRFIPCNWHIYSQYPSGTAILNPNFILRSHELQIDSSKRNIVGDICYLWDYEDQLMWGFCMEESVLLEDIYVDPHRPLNLIIPIHIVYNNA